MGSFWGRCHILYMAEILLVGTCYEEIYGGIVHSAILMKYCKETDSIYEEIYGGIVHFTAMCGYTLPRVVYVIGRKNSVWTSNINMFCQGRKDGNMVYGNLINPVMDCDDSLMDMAHKTCFYLCQMFNVFTSRVRPTCITWLLRDHVVIMNVLGSGNSLNKMMSHFTGVLGYFY